MEHPLYLGNKSLRIRCVLGHLTTPSKSTPEFAIGKTDDAQNTANSQNTNVLGIYFNVDDELS